MGEGRKAVYRLEAGGAMRTRLSDVAAEWMRDHSKTVISCNDVSDLHEIYTEYYRQLGKAVRLPRNPVQQTYRVMRAITHSRRGRELFDVSRRMNLPGNPCSHDSRRIPMHD